MDFQGLIESSDCERTSCRLLCLVPSRFGLSELFALAGDIKFRDPACCPSSHARVVGSWHISKSASASASAALPCCHNHTDVSVVALLYTHFLLIPATPQPHYLEFASSYWLDLRGCQRSEVDETQLRAYLEVKGDQRKHQCLQILNQVVEDTQTFGIF